MDLNEHAFPAGGWAFYEPSTKWRAPTPIASTLNQTVMLVIEMRKKNPAITAKHKLSTNPEAVKSEILRFNRKRLGLPEEGTPLPFSDSHRFPGQNSAGAVVAEGGIANLKRAAQGAAVVLDWLGSGAQPVEQELAERRAAICVACPKNVAPSWFSEGPGQLIKAAVESWRKITGKVDFEFKNSQGEKLKSCDVCKCVLPLKIYVPLKHIVENTKPEVMAEFPNFCWIKNSDA